MPVNRRANNTLLSRHYADIHLHAWQDFATVEPEGSPFAGLNSRLADQMRTLLSAPPPADRSVPCIIQGDVVHKRGVITPEVGWAVSTWLMRLREQHERVLIFPGNHDYPLKAGAQWVHALSPFIPFGVGGIEIMDSWGTFDIADDVTLYVVPWMPDIEDWRHAIAEMAEDAGRRTGYSILATHIAVQGGRMANGHAFTGRGATLEDLHEHVFDQVLLGDFHARQALAPNVHYIGAPMQHHWGDAGDSRKGFAEVWRGRGDNALSVRFHDLESPRFIETSDMKEAVALRNAGHYVRVVSDQAAVLDLAAAEGMATVREVPPPPTSRIQLRPGSRPKDVLLAYFEQGQYGGDLDQTELMKLGASILDDTCCADEQQAGSMRLLQVSAANFFSYDMLDVRLDDRGVVLLDGINEDDPDADSNGSGKSTVIEAVTAGLYGKTLRNVPVAEWVKKGKRWGWVRVSADTPRGELVITRNRNCPDLPPGVSATLDGSRIDSTASDFQSKLDEILGMDFKTFTQVAVFGQEVPRVFAEESDSGRKELLESLCGGEQFDAPHAHVKSLHASVVQQVATSTARLEELNRLVSCMEQDISRLLRERDDWEVGRTQRLERENEALRIAEESLKRYEEQAAAVLADIEEVQASLRELDDGAVVTALRDAEEQLAQADRAFSAATRELHHAEFQAEARSEALERFRRDAADDRGATCVACGRPLEQADPEEQEAHLVADVAAADAELRAAREAVTQKTAARDRIQEAVAAARAGLEQRRELEGALAAHRNMLRSLESDLSRSERQREQARQRVADLENEENRYAFLITEKEAALTVAHQDIGRVTTDKESAEGVIPYLAECVRLFGNQGLRTFLFDSLAPQITNEANRALSILTGGAMSVAVTTERRARSEKIVLEVRNERGAPSFGGNSGGQKRKVNLALCWAIASLAAGRVNLLFIDEAFDSLDSTAGLRVCDLLESRERETGTIIVTSHRTEFREAFPVVWTARRSGGNSKLEVP